MRTPTVLFATLATLAASCAGSGGSCPVDTNDATFDGVLTVVVPSDASLGGSAPLTLTVANFQPDVEQGGGFCDSPERYCGARSVPVILGPTCSVTVSIDSVNYDARSCHFTSASASVVSAQSCTLTTNGASVAMTIQAGTVSFTPSLTQLTFSGVLSGGGGGSVTVQYQGS